jgi:hypothetical protein
MRVELYSQRDRWLFVHIDHQDDESDFDDEFVAWANDPLGWMGSGLPSIASLYGRAIDRDGYEAIVFSDRGTNDELCFHGFEDGIIAIHVRDMDRFVRTLAFDREGHTLLDMDHVHLVTGPIEGMTVADLSAWQPHRYAHWIYGVRSPTGPRSTHGSRHP